MRLYVRLVMVEHTILEQVQRHVYNLRQVTMYQHLGHLLSVQQHHMLALLTVYLQPQVQLHVHPVQPVNILVVVMDILVKSRQLLQHAPHSYRVLVII